MEKGTTLKNCLLLQQQGVISTGFIAYLKHTTTQTKVIYPKYYKKYAYALAHKMSSVDFSLFWPKKVHLEAKIYNFLTFRLLNF